MFLVLSAATAFQYIGVLLDCSFNLTNFYHCNFYVDVLVQDFGEQKNCEESLNGKITVK